MKNLPNGAWQWLDAAQMPAVPTAWREMFYPATAALYEWTAYRVRYPGATRLRVGTRWLEPLVDDLFLLQVQNQLGLLELQPFDGATPLCEPLHLEVLSPKFPTFAAHTHFLGVLLRDLMQYAATLPFVAASATSRGVQPQSHVLSPAPLWILNFFTRYGADLQAWCAQLHAHPPQTLTRRQQRVPLAQVSHVEADTLQEVLTNSFHQTSITRGPLARALHGHAPRQIRQIRVESTFNTPQNRWAKGVLTAWAEAAASLTRQPWWAQVPTVQQEIVQTTRQSLQHLLASAWWQEVGETPAAEISGALLQRGLLYRQLWQWSELYHATPTPLWARWEHALQLRDVASLYEIWTFFRLVDGISELLGETPELSWQATAERGLQSGSVAKFGTRGTLVYNQAVASYSTPLRPDFSWAEQGRVQVVFDAKFRMEQPSHFAPAESTSYGENVTAKHADGYKMHAYRDALGVRAAVSVYPGTASVFYTTQSGARSCTLREVLLEPLQGIGALALAP